MALTTPAPRVLADYVAGTWVRQAALVVTGAAFVGLAAQIAIPLPFTPVPLTLQTFAVLLAASALGTVRGVLSMALYALAGIAGIPWFAEGSSGFTMPSFGYILGFIAAAFIVGRLAENGATRQFLRSAGLMIIGSVVIYAIGFTWLKFSLGVSWFGADSAWVYGVQPFIVGDVVKLLAASALLPATWRIVERFAR
jgi:biotin transport system substrate-specific component